MADYLVPQLEIFQEFRANPALQLIPLRACLVGPHAFLRRHSVASERAVSGLGTYDPNEGVAGAFPGRPSGSKIDPSRTRIFIDNARLETYHDPVGSKLTIAPVSGKPLRIRASGTRGFKANGVAHPRLVELYSRDVQPGDKVSLRGTASGTTYTLDTYVRRVLADPTAAVVGTATAASTNLGDQNSSFSLTRIAGPEDGSPLNVSSSGYSALGDGNLSDTYTIEVIQGSVGNDHTTAILRITTLSGVDEVAAQVPAAAGTPFDVGTRGLQFYFPVPSGEGGPLPYNLQLGEAWTLEIVQRYEEVTATSSGTYTGDESTTYIVEVTRGGFFEATDVTKRPLFRVRTTTGSDAASGISVNTAAGPYPVGTQGVQIAFSNSAYGIAKGSTFLIPATAASDGRFAVLELGHALSEGMQAATDLDLRISIERDVEVSEFHGNLVNWTQDVTTVTVSPNLTATDSAIVNNGALVDLPVMTGTVTVEYRAWRSDLAWQVLGLNDTNSLDAAISGPLDPSNPIKFAMLKALANSNGTEVKYLIVDDPTNLASWSRALDLAGQRTDLHGIVPLSEDRAVIDLFTAHAASLSGPARGKWRAAWVSTPTPTLVRMLGVEESTDNSLVLAEVGDDPGSAGTQYTYVTLASSNAGFIDLGIRAGDVLRTNFVTEDGVETYTSHVIDAILAENQLRLSVPLSAPTFAPQRIEIWRDLNPTEIATRVASTSGSFGSRRVRHVKCVGPLTAAGVPVPDYMMAAALAGYRSGVLPQAGLTNAGISGFDAVNASVYGFSIDDLDTMAASGTWLVEQRASGAITSRHALTTIGAAAINLAEREESMNANLDAISYIFRQIFLPLIGRINVSNETANMLRTDVQQVIDRLKSNGASSSIGSSLRDGVIRICEVDRIQADAINVEVDVTLPAPFNYGRIHLVVQ